MIMPKKPVKKHNILILEDEPVVLKMLESLLSNEGYTCFVAATGDKALEIVEQEKIDLFLTDIMIPKRHGIAIAWEMRTRGYDMPIVIVSAFVDQWDKEVFKDCKIDRWISKPAKPNVLFQVIRELLESSAAEHGRQDGELAEHIVDARHQVVGRGVAFRLVADDIASGQHELVDAPVDPPVTPPLPVSQHLVDRPGGVHAGHGPRSDADHRVIPPDDDPVSWCAVLPGTGHHVAHHDEGCGRCPRATGGESR